MVDPADVVVGQGVADGEEPLVGLPQREMAEGVAGRVHDLPVGVAEAEHLTVGQGLVDGVGADRLVEVLGQAAARVPTGNGIGVGGARCDACPCSLQQSVRADVVGVPVGVHHEHEVAGVAMHPVGGDLRVPDEAAVDERRLLAGEQEQVGVRERSLLPDHLAGQQQLEVGHGRHVLTHHCAGRPLNSCQ